MQNIPDRQHGPLPVCFIVRQFGHPAIVGNTLDLNTRSTFTAHVHIGTGRSDPAAYLAGTAIQKPDIVGSFLDFVGVFKLRISNGFNQWHPKTVGAVNPHMTDI